MVARSNAKAEFKAITHGICKMFWLKRVLEELRRLNTLLVKLYYDNKVVISIAHNLLQHDKTKHIEIDKHFMKEKLKVGAICFFFVPTMQQITNILTKGLLSSNFEFLVHKLGMIDIYAPT